MSRKKIVFYLPNLCGGGAERVSMNILNQLSREKYEIHLLLGVLEGEAIHLIPKDIEVHTLNSPKTLFSLFKLRKKLKEINPYIVFSSLNRAHIALNFALKGIRNKPKTIMRVPSSPKLVFKYQEMSKLFKFLLDISLSNATLVIAQTPEMKEEIFEYHNVSKNKIDVLINPLNRALIDESIKEEFDLFDKNNINVVASGRLSIEKGYDILIEAFSKVYQKNKNYRLYIIGADNGNQMSEYIKLIDKFSLQGIVNFLGFQINPYKFYFHSDLFVLSSRREGLPNTILENLYLNKSVVGTRCIPFMEELIINGENGCLVDVESINQLVDAILNFKKLSLKKGFMNDNLILKKDIFSI